MYTSTAICDVTPIIWLFLFFRLVVLWECFFFFQLVQYECKTTETIVEIDQLPSHKTNTTIKKIDRLFEYGEVAKMKVETLEVYRTVCVLVAQLVLPMCVYLLTFAQLYLCSSLTEITYYSHLDSIARKRQKSVYFLLRNTIEALKKAFCGVSEWKKQRRDSDAIAWASMKTVSILLSW